MKLGIMRGNGKKMKKGSKVPEGQMDFFPLIVDLQKKAIMKNPMIMGRWHFQSKYSLYLIRAAISEVKMGDKSFGKYFFTIGSIAEAFHVDKAYVSKNIESWLDEIYNESLILHESARGYVKYRWVTTAAYDRKEGYGMIQLSHDLIPFVTDIEGGFGGYEIKTLLELGSVYAARIYDILNVSCDGYEFTQETHIYISVKQIRFACGLDAVDGEEEKLAFSGNVRQRIIEPSIARISEVKQLEITYEPRNKKGTKAVEGYDFTIKPKRKDNNVENESKKVGEGKSKKSTVKKNSFNNFEQHDYDFEELERQLISN